MTSNLCVDCLFRGLCEKADLPHCNGESYYKDEEGENK